MKLFLSTVLAAAVSLAVVAPAAQAAEIKISQKGKKFSQKKVDAAVGDVLVFVNDDKHTHNLYTRKGIKFDSGAMATGAVFPLKLDKNGKFTVRCAIHPRMKLKVTVK